MHVAAPASRALLVTAMCLGSMLTMFTSTLVNLMVPAIADEFGASAVGLEWVATSYTLAYGALLLLGGALGGAYGRRRMLLIGIGVFAVASLACAAAPSLELLLTGRIVQGAAVALYLPQTLAILSTEFTDSAARAKVVGLWAGLSSLGLSAGPVLGGVIVDIASWRVGFLVSTALAVIAFGMGIRGVSALRHGRADPGAGVDVVGAALGTAGLVGLVELFMRLPASGIADSSTWAFGLVALVCLPLFLLWQRRQGRAGRPTLMPLGLWRVPAFLAANLAGFAYFFMFFAVLYFYAVDLQDVRGLGPLAAGLLFLPMMLLTALFGPIAGRAAARFGSVPVLAAGLVIGALGCLLLALRDPSAGLVDLEVRLGLLGIASGLMSSSMSNLAVSQVAAHLSSTAAAVHNTLRQIGSTLGVAVFGVIIAAAAQDRATSSGQAPGGQASSGQDSSGQAEARPAVVGSQLPGLDVSMALTAVLLALTVAAVSVLGAHGRTRERRTIRQEALS